MYFIAKTIEISASHVLDLEYDSKCTNRHGHNYIVTVYIKSEKLNKDGMVCDFVAISKIVNKFDHVHLNDFLGQPTAELLAKRICKGMNLVLEVEEHRPVCYEVEVEETEGSIIRYVKAIED